MFEAGALLVKGAAPLVAAGAKAVAQRGALERAVQGCVRSALMAAATGPLGDADPFVDAALRDLLDTARCTELFFPFTESPRGLDEARADWSASLAALLRSHDGLELDGIDVEHLADRFGTELALAIRRHASQPASALLNTVIVTELAGRNEARAVGRTTQRPLRSNLPEALVPVHHEHRTSLEGDVRRILAESGRCVLTGSPGVGKSAIAHAVVQDLDRAIWLRAGDEDALVADARTLVDDTSADPVSDLLRRLDADPGWTVVLDGVTDLDVVARFLSRDRALSALVSTHVDLRLPDEWCVAVGLLSAAESRRVLAGVSGRAVPPSAATDALLAIADGSPLALQQIGTYLRSTHISEAEMVARLRAETSAVLDRYAPRDHPRSFTELLVEGLRQAGEQHEMAQRVLRLVSVCGDVGTPRALIWSALGTGAVDGDDAVAALEAVGLVESRVNGSLWCHSLVADVVRGSADAESVETVCRSALAGFDDHVVAPTAATYGVLAPAVRRVVAAARRGPDADFDSCLRLARLAMGLSSRSGLEAALADARVLVPRTAHPDASEAMVLVFAAAFQTQEGRHAEAAAPLERGIELARASGNRAALSVGLDALAVRNEWLGRVDDALAALAELGDVVEGPARDSVDQRRRALLLSTASPVPASAELRALADDGSLAPADRAAYGVQLARALMRSGRAAEAEPRLRAALAETAAQLGETSTTYAAICNDLGWCLVELDDDEGAEDFLRRSISIYDVAAEGAHPHAALPYLHLARLASRRAMRHLPSGEPVHADLDLADGLLAEASSRLASGASTSPDMAAVLYEQGTVHTLRGGDANIVLALECYEAALTINRAAFGVDSVQAASDAARIAMTHLSHGDLPEAERALEDGLRFYRSHPEAMDSDGVSALWASVVIREQLGRITHDQARTERRALVELVGRTPMSDADRATFVDGLATSD